MPLLVQLFIFQKEFRRDFRLLQRAHNPIVRGWCGVVWCGVKGDGCVDVFPRLRPSRLEVGKV